MAMLVCFLVFDVNAQIVPPVVEWKKNLGGDRNDFATSIIRSRDNGYIVLGTTYSINGNVNGQLLQQKRISNRTNAELILQKEKAGTYLLSVYDEKKKTLLGSVKIVKQ